MASHEMSLFAAEANAKEKSPNALRTISEASELLDIPQHVLRFWETKFTQIKPLKRNGGRRFYRPQDLEILQQIKHLLYAQGYTIKGAQKAIADFAATRSSDKNAAPIDRWATPSFPPAHGNDNAEPEREFDILSEIADLLSEPEVLQTTAPANVADRASLEALRSELAAMRDELSAKLTNVA